MDFTKPRVAIYYFVVPQTGYRNDGPPLFLNFNLRKVLNGCKNFEEAKANMADDTKNVVHLWPSIATHHFGKFDLHILVDHGEDVISGIPQDWEIPHPSAYWVSDAHIDEKGFKYRAERSKQFDFVFVCQKWFREKFIEAGVDPAKIHYLPHAVEPDVYKPYSILKKWDWCFIGHLNSQFRINLCDRFVKEIPIYDPVNGARGRLAWRMPEVPGRNVLDHVAEQFSQSRIVLNDNINNDVNMRTFEALATKSCLLTLDIPELHGVFDSGRHLVTYKTIDEAVELAKGLLIDEQTRQAIAQAGFDEVIAKHTYRHRAEEILKTCLNYSPEIKGELAAC